MSVTYNIGCKECKRCLWIAQSSRSFYSGEPHTMEALKEFLFEHYGHPLVFSDSDSFDEYEEIDANKYKTHTPNTNKDNKWSMTHQQPSSNTPLEKFKEKKQELKDWLYGTVYKGYDTEETAEVVQSDVEDHFTDEWFQSLLTSHSEAIRDRVEGMRDCTDMGGEYFEGKKIGYNQALDDILALLNENDI